MQSLVRGEWRRDEKMMGEINLGSMLPEAGVRSSPCSRSVRDRPRTLPALRARSESDQSRWPLDKQRGAAQRARRAGARSSAISPRWIPIWT